LALADKERRAHYLLETHEGRNLYREIRVLADEIQDAESAFKLVQFKKLGQIKKEAKITFAITAVTSALLIIGMFILIRINLRESAKYRLELE
ncbi:hypothetical protein, partial [Staphylococcus aureus]|uniref:hypothetical protein n=1 Tax=Staphylococcus aureus TaxID=1280 RepID=UPI00301DC9A1